MSDLEANATSLTPCVSASQATDTGISRLKTNKTLSLGTFFFSSLNAFAHLGDHSNLTNVQEIESWKERYRNKL